MKVSSCKNISLFICSNYYFRSVVNQLQNDKDEMYNQTQTCVFLKFNIRQGDWMMKLMGVDVTMNIEFLKPTGNNTSWLKYKISFHDFHLPVLRFWWKIVNPDIERIRNVFRLKSCNHRYIPSLVKVLPWNLKIF